MRASLLELLAPSRCPVCDDPRAPGEPLLCPAPACQPVRLARLGRVRTAFAYRGAGLALVRRFKFEGRRDALEVVAALLAVRVERVPFDLIVPVPRHPRRIRALGADPVHALVRELSRRARRPLSDGLLCRRRATPPQTGLSPLARRANVSGSFAARPAPRGMRLLLLDDVATTGATLAEAALALRAAGARGVLPAAAAGTPPLEDPTLSPDAV